MNWRSALGEAKPVIPVIVGPTAVGKTAVVDALSRHWRLTVISADSRQVYRGMDIGTAKPSAELLGRVPHLGLDLIEPGERYSAGQFARDATRWMSELNGDRQGLVVGGTGFYIRALADGLFREPPMDASARERFRIWAAAAEGLGRWAARLDRNYGGGGRQRAARTVEVALLTGHPLSWWQQQAKREGAMDPWYVRLTVPRAYLHVRITERVQDMLDAGLIAEVENLLGRGVDAGAAGLDGVGYREVVSHLRGELPFDELAGSIAASTRQYAKRQETWFRNQLSDDAVINLDATDTPSQVAEQIVELWERRH
jgi:tRNA dimethylallyltransferase